MPHKYIHNLQAVYNEDDISYYLLGAYITDGCVAKNGVSLNTELKSADYDWLCRIRDVISPQSPIKKANGNCHRLRINSKEFALWLIKHNCVPNKSLIVEMPPVPKQYLSDFVRGCIDGDGSIGTYTKTNGTSTKLYSVHECYIVSASKSFIYKLQSQLKENGLHSTVNKKKMKGKITILKNGQKIVGKHDQYLLKFTGKYCRDILQFAYYKEHKLSMTRKKKIANRINSLFIN
jgi:hypothetical protein